MTGAAADFIIASDLNRTLLTYLEDGMRISPVIDALQSVEVTYNTNAPSGFQLTFSLSSKSTLNTIGIVIGARASGQGSAIIGRTTR